MASLLSTLRLLAFCIFALFGSILQAADLRTQHPPQGDLKVRLDYGLARQEGGRPEGMHRWVYSSYLVFEEPVSSITPGQLKMIAIDAFREMEADMMQYNPNPPRDGKDGKYAILPGALTIMAFDNKIILSSSQKGKDGFLNKWPNSEVKKSLDLCSALWRDRVVKGQATGDKDQYHRTKAKCGEVNAFHQYYMTHETPIKDLTPKARVTTVTKFGNGRYRIIPPCGTERNGQDSKKEWGCNLLVPNQKVDYLEDVQEQGYDLGTIAGGVQRIGQISMCTRNRITWSD